MARLISMKYILGFSFIINRLSNSKGMNESFKEFLI